MTVVTNDPTTPLATLLSEDVLYATDGGEIICGKHLGMASTAAITRAPNLGQGRWRTAGPDGTIFRVDVAETQAAFTEAGLGAVACETCTAAAR